MVSGVEIRCLQQALYPRNNAFVHVIAGKLVTWSSPRIHEVDVEQGRAFAKFTAHVPAAVSVEF